MEKSKEEKIQRQKEGNKSLHGEVMLGAVIAYIYIVSCLIVSITGAFLYRTEGKKFVRRVILFIWVYTLIEVSSKFVVAPLLRNTLWLFNGIIPVYFILMGIIYCDFFKENIRVRKMIGISTVVFLLFYAANILWMQDFYNNIYNYSIAAMSLFVVLCAFLYFHHKMRQPPAESLRSDPMFWVSSGLLIFYGAQAFAMGSINYLNEVDRSTSSAVLSIVQGIGIIMNGMLLIGILCQRNRMTSCSR